MLTIYPGKKILPVKPCVATIGFFDGVHRGHRFLIERLKEDAKAAGLESTVITFERHPRQVLSSDYQPKLLTTFEEKRLLLSRTGVDNCAVLQFDRQMAQMTAREFMERVLTGLLNVKRLYIGYDHRFGHNREEGFEDYVRYGRELGIEVLQNTAFDLEGKCLFVGDPFVPARRGSGDGSPLSGVSLFRLWQGDARCAGRSQAGFPHGEHRGYCGETDSSLGGICRDGPAGRIGSLETGYDEYRYKAYLR